MTRGGTRRKRTPAEMLALFGVGGSAKPSANPTADTAHADPAIKSELMESDRYHQHQGKKPLLWKQQIYSFVRHRFLRADVTHADLIVATLAMLP